MSTDSPAQAGFAVETGGKRPWPALWALVIGFFMILVDANIVQVAIPAIIKGLDTDINGAIWVTSAYLLAYAVPLLVTGRLGDRIGPKNVYLAGLVLFTVASFACGISGSIGMLIAARVVQGLGAALLTPQTMAVITRMFAPDKRGAALGLWGSVAGVAILVGPIVGGILVDNLGWEWIFFINVPVGVIGFVVAWRLVPTLRTHEHTFDWLGVLLSAAGMFLLVFGIQEGETYDWGTIRGPITVWRLIIVGILVLVLFVWWQARNTKEPLLPLGLFRDRNFSLANVAITAVGFAVTALGFPLILYAQTVRGLTPTQSALLLTPLAVISGALAPFAGRFIQARDPRWMAVGGLLLFSVGTYWYSRLMHPQYSVLWLLAPAAVLGVANAGIWGPLSITATRNLAPKLAGAGAGVYNTTRQVGAVLGSAAIATVMESRLAAHLPGFTGSAEGAAQGGGLPARFHAPFSDAMADSILLPGAVLLVGVVAALFFASPHGAARRRGGRHVAGNTPGAQGRHAAGVAGAAASA
ncbi:DHA2 family efflux MFS transporter permease subunit, partial [Nostocoides japonicum]|uniref:DHA2 family efflux MFS transporter permease subunit n=1 Tax=Nostocoides japonicum TaxID=99481 RepID=UPI0009F96C4A